MARSFFISVATFRTSRRIRCALLHEARELALERLGHAGMPALGDGLGGGIREDFLFASLQSIEDPSRCGLGSSLRNLESAVHIGVDGAQDDGMDRHALARQKRAQ